MAVRARALDNETGAKRPGAHGGLYKRSLLCSGWPADLAPSGRGGAWRMPTTMGGAPRDAPAGIVPLSGHVGDLLCCSHVAPCAARDMEDSVAVLRTRHGRTPWRPNATAGRDTDEPALDVVARSEGGQRSASGHRLPACYGFALADDARWVRPSPSLLYPLAVAGSSGTPCGAALAPERTGLSGHAWGAAQCKSRTSLMSAAVTTCCCRWRDLCH